MKKKFYQNYVVANKEEAFVILKKYIKGKNVKEGYMDEHICNVFIEESIFGKDKVDTSCCYLVTHELNEVLCKWVNCNNLSEISSMENFDFLEEDIVKSLYKKFVGSSNMDSLYKEDLQVFGKGISWYKENPLFQNFWNLEN